MRCNKDLSEFELVVLKGISLGFNYKKLAEKLGVDEEEVVEVIKTLIKNGYVTYKSKLIGGKLKLTKKGYEVLAKYGGGISLKSKVYEKIAKEITIPTQPVVVQKSSSKLKKIIIACVILFFVFAIVLPRLPVLLTVISGESSGSGPIKPLEIEVASFSVKSIDMSGLKGTIYFKVHNPNIIPATIDRITYNIYDEDGNLLAQGEIPRTYTVPIQRTITIQNDISVGWTEAFHIIKNKIKSWFTGEKDVWTIEGVIYVNIGPTTFDVPFTTNFELR